MNARRRLTVSQSCNRARVALKPYMVDETNSRAEMIDLLTDLRHLAGYEGIDFSECLIESELIHEEEVTDNGNS